LRINKLVFSGIEAPDPQGANSQEYLDIPRICTAAGRDASALENAKLFLSKPLKRH
jgi:hypothetical protein